MVLGFELKGLTLSWQVFLLLEPLHQSFFVMEFFSRLDLRNYMPGASFEL
jgi:hypothetical protein